MKNCNTCTHLEWVDGDDLGTSGFVCNKRQDQMFQRGKEQELLDNLELESYRLRGKRCHEPVERDK